MYNASTQQPELFKTVEAEIQETLTLPHDTKADLQTKLTRLETALNNLDRLYHSASHSANQLSVERAVILGRVCLVVKEDLLHGTWTTWVHEHVAKGIRTVQKFMSLARSRLPDLYGHLGTERLYELTKLEHLLEPGMDVSSLFAACELDTNLDGYSSKDLESAVTVVLNREVLNAEGLHLNSDLVKALTGALGLLKWDLPAVSSLIVAKSIDGDLDKAASLVIATGGGRQSQKKGAGKRNPPSIHDVLETYIETIGRTINTGEALGTVNHERLVFALTLTQELIEALKLELAA